MKVSTNQAFPHLRSFKLPLPNHWNINDKCKHLVVDDSKLRVSYKGVGKYDTDAAAIRADRPIPPACGLFYFEVTIISKGRDGHIGIGLCAPSTSLSRLPGWDAHSYGYHADDGFLFKGTGGAEYGPTFTTGDVIGCCVNFRTNSVLYTKNGLPLGVAFTGILTEPLHPSIGLRTPGEIVEANFGQKPFVFNFSHLLHVERESLVKEVMAKPFNGLDAVLPKLVLQYLIHYGYSKSASTFAEAILQKPSEKSLASIEQRQQIIIYIMNGEIDRAMDTIAKHHPHCLENKSDIQFQLKYFRFIQMILTESPETTIKYGRENFLFDDPQVIENQQILDDVFSLLAYPDPTNCPVSYLFSPPFRTKLANLINGAILEYYEQPKISNLEKCIAHNELVVKYMITQDVPAAALSDTSWLLESSAPIATSVSSVSSNSETKPSDPMNVTTESEPSSSAMEITD